MWPSPSLVFHREMWGCGTSRRWAETGHSGEQSVSRCLRWPRLSPPLTATPHSAARVAVRERRNAPRVCWTRRVRLRSPRVRARSGLLCGGERASPSTDFKDRKQRFSLRAKVRLAGQMTARVCVTVFVCTRRRWADCHRASALCRCCSSRWSRCERRSSWSAAPLQYAHRSARG